MEQVNLATPVVQSTTSSSYRIVALYLDVERGAIAVHLKDNNGAPKQFVYEQAGAMLRALNTANLSTRSLHARIMDRLIADGHLVGVVGGTPDAP